MAKLRSGRGPQIQQMFSELSDLQSQVVSRIKRLQIGGLFIFKEMDYLALC
jgi:hypothetical protein